MRKSNTAASAIAIPMLAALFGSVVMGAPLSAQRVEDRAVEPLASSHDWLIGVATSARGGTGDLPLFLKVGREWHTKYAALGVRLEGVGGYADDRTYYQPNYPALLTLDQIRPPLPIRTDSRSLLVGGAVSASYTVQATRRIRPYLLSGAGLFHSRDRLTTRLPHQCLPHWSYVGPCPPGVLVDRLRDTSLGLHGGFGMRVTFGSVDVFLEQEIRKTVGDQRETRFGKNALYPLTLGLRF